MYKLQIATAVLLSSLLSACERSEATLQPIRLTATAPQDIQLNAGETVELNGLIDTNSTAALHYHWQQLGQTPQLLGESKELNWTAPDTDKPLKIALEFSAASDQLGTAASDLVVIEVSPNN